MRSPHCYASGCYIKFSLNKACPYGIWENGRTLLAEKNRSTESLGWRKKVLVFEGVRKEDAGVQSEAKGLTNVNRH